LKHSAEFAAPQSHLYPAKLQQMLKAIAVAWSGSTFRLDARHDAKRIPLFRKVGMDHAPGCMRMVTSNVASPAYMLQRWYICD
jgi:hypothetical protein